MTIREVTAKSILKRHSKIDSWLINNYSIDLYNGCLHNCVYCDGRAEGSFIENEFGKDVQVKVNAIEILSKELDPTRKGKPLKRSYVLLGSGVGDNYQPAEEKYQLTRKTLHLLYERNFPVHIVTKSVLVRRDADILAKINQKSRAIVSLSLSSADPISTIFEPGVPSPAARINAMKEFKQEGLAAGIILMPVIPFVTDTPDLIEKTVRIAKDGDANFVLFGGLTLKEGNQKEHFTKTLKENYPELVDQYNLIYPGNKHGTATEMYYNLINRRFHGIAKKYSIPSRIPPTLYRDILSTNDLLVVILEQIDYLLRLEGKSSNFGRAAQIISKMQNPIKDTKDSLKPLKSLGPDIEYIIIEIIKNGKSRFHEKLLGV